MKKIFTLIAACVLGVMSAMAAEDANGIDLEAYTAKKINFKGYTTDPVLASGGSSVGKAWDNGNSKAQDIFACTAPEELVDILAFQGIANSYSGRGAWVRSKYGFTSGGSAARAYAVINLKKDMIVHFNFTNGAGYCFGNTSKVTDIDNPGSGNPYTIEDLNSDGKSMNVTMTADGYIGFWIDKYSNGGYLTDITIYTPIVKGVCNNPTGKVTGANGKARTVQLACETENSEIYYSETELTKAEGGSKYTAPFSTEATTIYAYAKTSDATSEVISIETGAGSVIKLNAPVIKTTMVKSGDVYKPVYTFSSNQSLLIGAPVPSYSYTFNGVSGTGDSFAATETGILSVKSTATGYDNSDAIEITAAATEFCEIYSFDFASLTSHSDNAVNNPQTINGVGVQCYSIDSDAIEGITLSNVQQAWKITADEAMGLYTRSGKGSITVSNFPENSIVTYNGVGYTTKTTEFNIYTLFTDMAVYAPIPAPLELTLNAADFGTFSAAFNAKIEGAKVYTAKVDGEKIDATLIESGIVPAGKGVLLVKEGETVTATYTTEEANEDAFAENGLKATTLADGSLATLEAALVLSGNTFKNYTGDAFAANKAYFPYSTSEAKPLSIVFNDGETTGISAVMAASASKSMKAVINNKLVIVKGDKKYNVAGCEMK